MYGYIYETTNIVNGKKYIGQHTSNIFDEKYKGSGRSFKKALAYWGDNNFKTRIIEQCNNQDELNEREIYWIENLRNQLPSNMIYNISSGGLGNNGVKHLSEDHKRKIGDANRGRKLSEKSRANMSKAIKGFRWMNNGVDSIKVWDKVDIDKYLQSGFSFGRILSDKAKQKIILSNKNTKTR